MYFTKPCQNEPQIRGERIVTGRGGFALLEVLLSLGLSIVVVTVIGYAIFFHLRVLDSQRARVEQALVARGMLNLIAGDVRAAVQYKPMDVSQLEALASVTTWPRSSRPLPVKKCSTLQSAAVV